MAKIVFWFRRDLRLEDNRGFYEALTSGHQVLPLFIFDQEILGRLPDRNDRRVQFIHHRLQELQQQLRAQGSELLVRNGKPLEVFEQLLGEFAIEGVFLNRDHDPYPKRRDDEVKKFMADRGLLFREFQDHFVFEREQILTDKGTPYTVYTPYSKKWLARLEADDSFIHHFPSEKKQTALAKGLPRQNIPSLASLGFDATSMKAPPGVVPLIDERILKGYEAHRNDVFNPHATTQLGIHLRFGTLSVRELVRRALPLSQTYVKEIAWRDFFSQVLYHYPHVVRQSFRAEFDKVAWSQSQEDFQRWQDGMTGFPLVDAGMRELRATGTMPNRVRMNVASFLCKDLLIHWSWGERYFAGVLLDYDLSSNNGNWQWAAGTGCDAAPYFRVFNPELQRQKFDPKGEYVRRWVPEWNTPSYPAPMVDHAQAARRAIFEYGKVKKA
jgi:deoxyribodipyrimidine photo-lyase